MKSIINLINRGLLIAITGGGVSLSFAVGIHAAVSDSEVHRISSTTALDSADCVSSNRGPSPGIATDCVSMNKIALNSIAAKVGWDLDTQKLLPSASDASVSESRINPETSSTNGSPIVLATQSDSPSQVLTESAPDPGAPLSLDGNMRSNLDNKTTDSAVSEPLLTSILALIAIVAVARRNVSGS